MPVQIKYEPNETCVLRISGILKRSEFGAEERVAIVAEARWEPVALAFAGAGVRRTPVKFFPPSELGLVRGINCHYRPA